MKRTLITTIASVAMVSCAMAAFAAEDIVIADFEGDDYGHWSATGDAFGTRPSKGTRPPQKEVTGFLGKGLVNTYTAERVDEATGTLTSRPFTIERKHVNFLVGGGNRPDAAELRLLLEGKPVRRQTGHAETPQHLEKLYWRNWDVSELTGKTVRIEIIDRIGGGWGHLLVDQIVQSDTPRADKIPIPPVVPPAERFKSPTPRTVFSETLGEQEKELAANELMLRFAESRKAQAADPHRPAYHFISPESMLNDPNGLCYWKGRWHLFYQAYPPDEFPRPVEADIMRRRQHWGHAVSDDMVRWRDLPYAIYPGTERMCFSGATVVEPDRVSAFYPGIAAGQMLAQSSDPLLLNWTKPHGNGVVHPRAGDSCIWKDGDTYFALLGNFLMRSDNLKDWRDVGPLLDLAGTGVPADNNACPYFWPLGESHIYLFFSHENGGQYYLGDYDKERFKFRPYAHGRFNHGKVSPGGVHAPSAYPDPNRPGSLVNIFNINDGIPAKHWDQIMSVPQQMTLADDKSLCIEPIETLASLREDVRQVGRTVLPANKEVVLDAIQGNSMELQLDLDPQDARWVQLSVLRSPDAQEKTTLTFYNAGGRTGSTPETQGHLVLDAAHSSLSSEAWVRPPETAILTRHGTKTPGKETFSAEPLRLRVFIDRSVVEVFANERLFMAARVYPTHDDSVGVSLKACGRDAVLQSLKAWQMTPIWPVK